MSDLYDGMDIPDAEFMQRLCAEFPPEALEDKGGFTYIKWLPIHKRLDMVAGPDRWQQHFTVNAGLIVCALTIELPSGRQVTRSGVSSPAAMHDHDPVNEAKAGARHAFRIAFTNFGCLYLYEDGHKPRPAAETASARPPKQIKVKPEVLEEIKTPLDPAPPQQAPQTAILCKCELPAVKRTSGPNAKNPNRDFMCCGKPRKDQCDFFEWAKEQPDEVKY